MVTLKYPINFLPLQDHKLYNIFALLWSREVKGTSKPNEKKINTALRLQRGEALQDKDPDREREPSHTRNVVGFSLISFTVFS